MLCKGCSEPIKGIVGETCPVCGTVYAEDKPAKVEVVKDAPEKLKVPLKEVAAKETAKKKK